MLNENDALKIIESFLQPRMTFVQSQNDKDEILRLAIELRKVADISPLLRFSVVSDIHIQYWDTQAQSKLSDALEDLHQLNPSLEALVINGDLGDGRANDYAKITTILQSHPLPKQIYYTIGNHDYYKAYYNAAGDWSPTTFPNGELDSASLERFLAFIQMPSVYYDRWIQDFHFIFLGSERYRQSDPANQEDAWLSSTQLSWLQSKLQENYIQHKPLFIFLHQPLQGTVSGSLPRGIVQHNELKQMLSQYPEVIFFTGHTHWELRLTSTLIRDVFTMVNSSSVSYPYDSNDQLIQGNRSEGLIVDVYEDRIHIRGRDFANGAWFSEADFIVKR
ncbi:3',5'-cyclic adenosine monophosphate phosphodiesterase CpdA [Paenibacillus allorhizoplanae]|uniref:3',5'-cyclic adenosine monophosphate phosphodiesterase CpdA n=1 Tax=Paenibacillus allorhizoplanae TaxID=2905648 RepID=A0ABM9BW42_9BACL|nr:metallophosphoesterase [Paenibacillus allorhizoplanae]CAH1194975.1 3',5'-cyclic adenosine monophosphate phosphodiesterase CpdA [Paenibacillus allorhizoplanae]